MQVSPDGRSVRLGITNVAGLRVGQPWYEDVDFEHVARVLGKEGDAVHARTQMRLDAAQVAGLVPLLQRFADTGRVQLPEKTSWGYGYLQFTDADGTPCSLQESFSAIPHVWLGPKVKSLRVGDADVLLHTVHEALVRDMDARDALLGFVPPPHPAAICEERGSLCVLDRMHLSRKGVAALLQHLRAFLDTGSLDQQQEGEEGQEEDSV
jgi:hypothetical protein